MGQHAAERDADGFAPLRGYAGTGDGRSVALIAADGDIDWWAVPDLDSPPVFCALLDPQSGGHIRLRPQANFRVERCYVEATNVVQTDFVTDSGRVRVTDSLNSGVAGRLPWAELARRIEGLSGSVEMEWDVAPGTALGTVSPWADDGQHGPLLHAGRLTLGVRNDGIGEAQLSPRSVGGTFTIAEGSRGLVAVVGTSNEPLFLPSAQAIDSRVDLTIQSWTDWSKALEWPGPWPEAVRRSALALKLLIYSPTGAIAAAATTSVPEAIGGAKNWDYRYTWVRDAAYTLDAFVRYGLTEETHAALAWLLSAVERHGPQLQPFYGLNGDLPDPAKVKDVQGYRASGPVVEGNDAAHQLQLGPFGDLFQIMLLSVRAGHVLDLKTQRLLADLADRCCDLWQQRDAGMWELHDPQHYTVSKMSCWQALDRAAQLADLDQLPRSGGRWRREADSIAGWVRSHCWSADRQAYVMYPGSEKLDAGVLLAARFGFDRGERMRATVRAVRAELGAGPWLYRYSGMQQEEGAFLACSFWLVEALAFTGNAGGARALMDELLDALSDTFVLTEMIDPQSGELLGNLPQALSHLALLNAANAVAEVGGS